jgi:FMN reductase
MVSTMLSNHRPTLQVLGISGSPTHPSRSTALLRSALRALAPAGAALSEIEVRDLPPAALLQADARHPQIVAALAKVQEADVVLVATPIYKAAYSGLLKAFLDLLPQDALRGKLVLPLATGGSAAHLLAIDYALKPVLGALGARHILDGVFATDSQFDTDELHGRRPDAEVHARLLRALQPLLDPADAAQGPNLPVPVRQMNGTARMPC